MGLYFRDDGRELDEASLVIHGGAGAVEHALRNCIGDYDDYRTLRDDGLGMFVVSAFATVGDATEDAIVSRMVHGTYGVALARTIPQEYELLPTADDDPELDPNIVWLQECHFDIRIPDPDFGQLLDQGPLDDEELLSECQSYLLPHLELLIPLFKRQPRVVR